MKNSAWNRHRWLEDYALFRALKARYGGVYYIEWPAELVQRDPSAIARQGGNLEMR